MVRAGATPRRAAAFVGLVLVVGLLAAALAWAFAGRWVTQDRTVWGYRAASDDVTTLTLVVGAGACDEDVRVRVVSESAVDIVVAASGRVRRTGACNASIQFVDVEVTLEAPIGGRSVHDAGGGEAPRQE